MEKWCILSYGLMASILLVSFKMTEEKLMPNKPPNIVMIVADDLGIGDIGCFGNDTIKTPNIDKLAREGVILRHHLSASDLCTPSRAALLTGRYPAKFGFEGTRDTCPVIAHVTSKVGLPQSEITIAEALSASGYATAIVGKWHLGSGCNWFGTNCLGPREHGFHHFYGLLFTLVVAFEGDHPFWIFDINDRFYQSLLSTSIVILLTIILTLKRRRWYKSLLSLLLSLFSLFVLWFLFAHYRLYTPRWWQVSPWMDKNCNGVILRNSEVVHQTVPFDSVFHEFINESVHFIHSSAEGEKPFFLFHSFAHVHTPMFASKEFSGRSKHGRYGDNVEEMDYGVGQIMKALRDKNLDENTIVYFTSDHGGHLEAIDPIDGQRVGGYNKQFKGGKSMGAAEGGIRVPGIFRWKGVFPNESHIDTPTSLLDIFPTFLDLAGLQEVNKIYPEAKELDGVSFASYLKDPNTRHTNKTLDRILIHHCRSRIQALRLIRGSKIYKLYLFTHKWPPNSSQCGWGIEQHCSCYYNVTSLSDSPVLYELNSDPYEDDALDSQSEEYKRIVHGLRIFLRDWRVLNPYPPSLFGYPIWNNILLPWLQPIKMS